MTILALDTSTPRGSVSVLADGVPVFSESFTADRSHSSALFFALEKARAMAAGFDAVAVGLGPGSYAGVRIGIAAALGFELALGSRLLGLVSVAALDVEAHDYIAIGDARRGSFYYSRVGDGVCVEGPLLVGEAELRALLDGTPPVFATEPLAAFPQARMAFPSAARLAKQAAAGCGIVQSGALEPIYLREPHITLPKVR